MRRGEIRNTFNDTILLLELPHYCYAKDKMTVKCVAVKINDVPSSCAPHAFASSSLSPFHVYHAGLIVLVL